MGTMVSTGPTRWSELAPPPSDRRPTVRASIELERGAEGNSRSGDWRSGMGCIPTVKQALASPVPPAKRSPVSRPAPNPQHTRRSGLSDPRGVRPLRAAPFALVSWGRLIGGVRPALAARDRGGGRWRALVVLGGVRWKVHMFRPTTAPPRRRTVRVPTRVRFSHRRWAGVGGGAALLLALPAEARLRYAAPGLLHLAALTISESRRTSRPHAGSANAGGTPRRHRRAASPRPWSHPCAVPRADRAAGWRASIEPVR